MPKTVRLNFGLQLDTSHILSPIPCAVPQVVLLIYNRSMVQILCNLLLCIVLSVTLDSVYFDFGHQQAKG